MQRESRERHIPVSGGVVLLLTTAYLVLREPAFEGQRRAEKVLPQMCTQLAKTKTLDQEACGLSAVTAMPVPRSAELEQALSTSLTNHGLKATRTTMSSESMQVQLDKVPFGAIAEWLQGVWQAQRMKVINTSIKYVGVAVLVNVIATL